MLGIKSELQLPAYATATATPDLSHICDLHHSSQQHQILNSLSNARDWTHYLVVSSWIGFHCATTGTLQILFLSSDFVWIHNTAESTDWLICMLHWQHFWMFWILNISEFFPKFQIKGEHYGNDWINVGTNAQDIWIHILWFLIQSLILIKGSYFSIKVYL